MIIKKLEEEKKDASSNLMDVCFYSRYHQHFDKNVKNVLYLEEREKLKDIVKI